VVSASPSSIRRKVRRWPLACLRGSSPPAAVRHTAGKSWTTDGIFRETPAKVARRRAEGCITVESEAAALFAVGSFRMVRVGVMLYAGDDLSGGAWNDRGWKQAFDARRRLFELAADAAVALDATLPSSYDTRQ
jgi:hypothetical protein